MHFSDEYEHDVGDQTYYISVSGNKQRFDNTIESIEIFNELGELIDIDHDDYESIYNDALDRDYEIELHSRDFDVIDEVEELF